MARPETYDHLRSIKKPNKAWVDIVMDPELADQYDEKVDENREHPSDELALEVEQIKDQMKECTVRFTFKSIGRKRYEKLMLAHPATPEQVTRARQNGEDLPGWNEETFPPALIAMSLVDPKLSPQEVDELWDDENWSRSETLALLSAAFTANSQRRSPIDLGNG